MIIHKVALLTIVSLSVSCDLLINKNADNDDKNIIEPKSENVIIPSQVFIKLPNSIINGSGLVATRSNSLSVSDYDTINDEQYRVIKSHINSLHSDILQLTIFMTIIDEFLYQNDIQPSAVIFKDEILNTSEALCRKINNNLTKMGIDDAVEYNEGSYYPVPIFQFDKIANDSLFTFRLRVFGSSEDDIEFDLYWTDDKVIVQLDSNPISKYPYRMILSYNSDLQNSTIARDEYSISFKQDPQNTNNGVYLYYQLQKSYVSSNSAFGASSSFNSFFWTLGYFDNGGGYLRHSFIEKEICNLLQTECAYSNDVIIAADSTENELYKSKVNNFDMKTVTEFKKVSCDTLFALKDHIGGEVNNKARQGDYVVFLNKKLQFDSEDQNLVYQKNTQQINDLSIIKEYYCISDGNLTLLSDYNANYNEMIYPYSYTIYNFEKFKIEYLGE